MDWIARHSESLQVIAAAVTALVWIFYLQLLLMTVMRQRRPQILIGTGAGVGLESACFISNLGFEPVYVMDLTLTVTADDKTRTAFITDRWEMRREDLKDPADATNKGPLASGEFLDAGRFADLLTRASEALGMSLDEDRVDRLELTVIASAAASPTIVAARREFILDAGADVRRLVPTSIETEQIRSYLRRRRIKQSLQERLETGERKARDGKT